MLTSRLARILLSLPDDKKSHSKLDRKNNNSRIIIYQNNTLSPTRFDLIKQMALDTKGCHGCGILTLSGTVYRKGEKEMCRACKCAQEATVRTPCGQNYCSMCGILIDQQGANYCSACTTLKNTFIRPEDYGKASAARCKCDFCSNDYSTSPPAHKFSKLELQFTPWKAPSEGSSQVPSEGSSCSKETVPATSQSEGLRENLVEEELRNKWEREQLSLKKKLVAQDSRAVKKILQAIQSKDTSKTFYIGGVDISFIKNNNVDACAALIIISFPQLKVVYKRLEMIQLTAPYIPGFLAFREVDSLISLYRSMLKNAPQYKPDVIFVDGNGRLHPRAFGLACHLGVLLDVPCVGVAKTLIHVDGIEDNADHKAKKQGLKNEGDTFPLTTNTGEVLGMALRGTRSAPNPIYVSLGHKISLLSAVTLVQKCCKYRIPEPTRFADLHSRQYLMDNKTDPEELIVREGENPPNEWQ